MSEYNDNCHDELAHLDHLIDSNIDQDGSYSYASHDMNAQEDSWQYEHLLGSETESQPYAEAHGSLPYVHEARLLPDYQEYDELARQSLSHSPSAPSFWSDVQPEEYSPFGRDGHDGESYPEFPPVFPPDARDFGWTDDSGGRSEQQFYIPPAGEQHTAPYPPHTQFFHDYSIAPADSSYPLGFPSSEESNGLSQREMSIEDEGFPSAYAFPGSSSLAFNFDHMYEPAPSNAARPSLLSEWIDISPRGFETLPDVGQPAASQRSFADSEGPASQAIEAMGSHESSLGLYASGCHTSPVDTGSLPDLSNSRRQTPGSGPMDLAGMERPSTPYRSVVQYGGRTEREYSDCCLPAGTPASFGHRFSVGGNSTLSSFTKLPSSRSSSYTTFAGSHSHYPEDGGLMSLDSRRPMRTSFPAITIPSPPQLFANTLISRSNRCANPPALTFPALLSPITDAHLQPRPKDTQPSVDEPQPDKESKKTSSRNKSDRPKRKRMHICNLCGKDFNRPSALLLHATVHTGERSNFCNVCGRSFSNLSNLRRHQRQLHVLESQMRLPEIPGPTSEQDAYNFGSQTRF